MIGHAQHQEGETSIDRVSQPLQFLQRAKKLSVGNATIELSRARKESIAANQIALVASSASLRKASA